jgi:hypothetical protein
LGTGEVKGELGPLVILKSRKLSKTTEARSKGHGNQLEEAPTSQRGTRGALITITETEENASDTVFLKR